eukprot:SAG22_NODE_138_length_18031_cov_5.796621_15_plen_251_part_00
MAAAQADARRLAAAGASGGGEVAAAAAAADTAVAARWLEPDMMGCTALHLACVHGRISVVKYLVERGADVEQATVNPGVFPFWTADNRRAAHWAAHNGHCAVVRYLIEYAGADPTQKEAPTKSTPLATAARQAGTLAPADPRRSEYQMIVRYLGYVAANEALLKTTQRLALAKSLSARLGGGGGCPLAKLPSRFDGGGDLHEKVGAPRPALSAHYFLAGPRSPPAIPIGSCCLSELLARTCIELTPVRPS